MLAHSLLKPRLHWGILTETRADHKHYRLSSRCWTRISRGSPGLYMSPKIPAKVLRRFFIVSSASSGLPVPETPLPSVDAVTEVCRPNREPFCCCPDCWDDWLLSSTCRLVPLALLKPLMLLDWEAARGERRLLQCCEGISKKPRPSVSRVRLVCGRYINVDGEGDVKVGDATEIE